MEILVLEDIDEKFNEISSFISSSEVGVTLVRSAFLGDFNKIIERKRFDLIIVDLLVPRFKDSLEAEDVCSEIVDACRDPLCINRLTPMLALTAFDDASDGNYRELNSYDISVGKFAQDARWKDVLSQKIRTSRPKRTFDVVIVCGLAKEVAGFSEAGYKLGEAFIHGNLDCRDISIGGWTGVLVTSARMGLVTCAITATQAIESFSPKLICMSGICAGIKGKAKILDVAIAEVCHQHDFGKWSVAGYEPEIYSVPLKAKLRAHLKKIVDDERDFRDCILQNVSFNKDELPDSMQRLEANVYLTVASSGSAVVADERVVEIIRNQQRKGSIFEMESFALYEAARLHPSDIPVFSAKAVVDDGTAGKNDKYHRLACILAARTVYECVRRLSLVTDPIS
jgi:nucleoside phosphorylase